MEDERKKRVYIVGCAESKSLTPKDDKEAEYWGVNNLWTALKLPWSRWFEIHNIDQVNGIFRRRENPDFRGMKVGEYMKQLGQLPCPVYMQKLWPEVPNAVLYPLQEILSTFGNYFTNTVSYMIALAIYEKFEEILIYGVDMAVATEYAVQRASCEFFIGWALGMGIKVYIPPEADLCKTRFLYGFQEKEITHFDRKINDIVKGMNHRLTDAENQERDFFVKKHQYIGAINGVKEAQKIWAECQPKD